MLRYAGTAMPTTFTRDTFLAALEAAGELVLPLAGESMGPLWARAEAVVVRVMGRGAPCPGEVVVFERNGRWYAHRLLARRGIRCLTKGDARWAWDRPGVRTDEVVGVVCGLVSGGVRTTVQPSRLRAAWELVRAVAAWPALR